MYEGGYDDFSVNTNTTNNDNPQTERKRRAGNAYLLATNPETFELMVDNNINLFHGTNANALPGILKYGMNSVDELSKQGITVTTGEEWSRFDGKRDFISFTDDLDIARGYSSMRPSKEAQNQESFSVLVGISSNDLEHLRTIGISSDTPEIGIRDNVPLEYIKMIGVPESKVEFVRKLVDDKQIIVAPINTNERFYYMDDSLIYLDDEILQELHKSKEQEETEKSFNTQEVDDLAKKRKMFGIKNIYNKIREKITNRGRDNEKCK